MSLFAPTVPNPFKLMIRRFFDEIWTKADFTHLCDLLGPRFNYHFHGETRDLEAEELVPIVMSWRQAFPDLRFEVEGIIADRNQAAARVVLHGTHEQEWQGIPPGGKSVEMRELMFFRFEDERIAEVWVAADEFALHRQLIGEGEESTS